MTHSTQPPGSSTEDFLPEGGLPLARRPRAGFSADEFCTVLEGLKWEVRFDHRAQRLDVIQPGSSVWEPYTDVLEARLRDHARVAFACEDTRGAKPYNLIQRDLKDFPLIVGHDNAVDSWLADYVERLDPWNGEDQVEGLLEYVFPDCVALNKPEYGDRAREVARWISRYLFVAPLQRADRPGSDLRQVPVLIGPQEGGKSSLVEWLACNNKDWFTDGVALDQERKKNDEATAGKVFVEIAEMTGWSKADIERMKVWLTSHQDGVQRAAYGKFVESYLRRWVAVGTANDTGTGVLPNDPSGNTRFVAFRVGEARRQPHTLGSKLRDECFAEAYAKYHAGEDGWTNARLPARLKPAQKTANEVHTSSDIWLEDALSRLSMDEYTSKDFYESLEPLMPHGTMPSKFVVSRTAHANGWVTKRVSRNKKQVRVWVRAQPLPDPTLEEVDNEPF